MGEAPEGAGEMEWWRVSEILRCRDAERERIIHGWPSILILIEKSTTWRRNKPQVTRMSTEREAQARLCFRVFFLKGFQPPR